MCTGGEVGDQQLYLYGEFSLTSSATVLWISGVGNSAAPWIYADHGVSHFVDVVAAYFQIQ